MVGLDQTHLEQLRKILIATRWPAAFWVSSASLYLLTSSSPCGFQYCEWVRVPPTDTGGEHWLSNILKRRADTTMCWLAPAWQAAVGKARELGWIV